MSRVAMWPLLGAVLVGSAVCLALPGTARSGSMPSGCTSIAAVPPTYSGIAFGAAIEGLFTNFNGSNGCTDCHTTAMGTQMPAGNLDLDPQDSPSPYANLINVSSPMYLDLVYVVPNHPEQSLLFQKINCDDPGGGARMPLGYPPGTLSPYQQALIYDWIAEGAPIGTTDGVFRNGFDVRGFVP